MKPPTPCNTSSSRASRGQSRPSTARPNTAATSNSSSRQSDSRVLVAICEGRGECAEVLLL